VLRALLQAAQLLVACGCDVGALLAALGHAPPPSSAAEAALHQTAQPALHAAVAAVLADATAAAIAQGMPQPPAAQLQPSGLEAQLALRLLQEMLSDMQTEAVAPPPRPAGGIRRRNAQCQARTRCASMRRTAGCTLDPSLLNNASSPPQVDGCSIFIPEDAVCRAYNLRYRVCETHLRAAAVEHQGQPQRFCQARQ
jgi:hypothetical protein